MATIKDVARHAGVSTSTVSHVLNHTRFVSDEITARVQTAVTALNYAPSALARSLKTQQTKALGMLITTSTNPFFSEVVRGVEHRCYQLGYSLILCNTEGDAKRLRANLSSLLQKRVDGLLIMCTEMTDDLNAIFAQHPGLPTVVMDWGPSADYVDRIQDNSQHGGYLATRYLIEQGHRGIGYLIGPRDKATTRQRLEGYQQAMNEAGYAIDPAWLSEGALDCAGGAAAATQLFNQTDVSQLTALLTGNDLMALGAIHELRERGLSVPEDISLVGYDDIPMARYFSPALTSISQPKGELGRLAVDTLATRLQSPEQPAKLLTLDPTLVIRDSVSAR